MWVESTHLKRKKIIKVADLHGYVLPHGASKFTGNIISHTLRFRPLKKINRIIILYYPYSEVEDIFEATNTYFHEYYVPWKALEYFFGPITYEGINVRVNQTPPLVDANTLLVVSADFSHFQPFAEARESENKAAWSLMFKTETKYTAVVDDMKTFHFLYSILPKTWGLQWIGRERSSGEKAVGYLSFLIRETQSTTQNTTTMATTTTAKQPDGMFVTVYDREMNQRECLGDWFSSRYKWTPQIEQNLIDKVIGLGQTTSRLTSGTHLDIPLTNYCVTYLYKDTKNTFIRGWHGLFYKAFYLPEVFLENTFNNGKWIKATDKKWITGNHFNLSETFKALTLKAGLPITRKTSATGKTSATRKIGFTTNPKYVLYHSKVLYFHI